MEYSKGLKKLKTLTGWRYFFKILSKKERVTLSLSLLFFLVSFSFISVNFYIKNTETQPAIGGSLTEGVIGSPRFINPVYAQADDVDRDLTELVYSGLMRYNEKGEIVKDMAEKYELLEDGKVFDFYLKENLLWSDDTPISADDIIFTVKAIQNPALKSPVRGSWLGIKAEKISELGVRFELRSPSAVFLENCTLKIMPKHIWEKISEQNFHLAIYNLEPVGSGPYKIKKESLIRDKEGSIKSLELVANPNYHEKSPYIQNISFLFFNNEDELISAFNSDRIDGFSFVSPDKNQQLKKEDSFLFYRFLIPRYFAVFFNPEKSKVLADKNVRLALNYGTDKKEIIDHIFSGKAKIVDSPILPDIYGLEAPENIYEFNFQEAEQILEKVGFIKGEDGIRERITVKQPAFQFTNDLKVGSTGNEVRELQKCLANPPAGGPDVYPEGEITGAFRDKTRAAVIKFQEKYKEEILDPYGLKQGTGTVYQSTRKKLNELCAPASEETSFLTLTLTTFSPNTTGQSMLAETALILKKQWEALGIKIEIDFISERPVFLEEKIRPRDYEMVLFGNALEINPDPFPFWHSSQTRDPGLNLSAYENKESDRLLEEARQTLDQEEKKNLLEKFQENLIKDAPAVFLYNPDYLYILSKEIKGVKTGTISDPSQRFSDINNWHIKTKRSWK